jgi:hypothetical protein
MKTLQVSMIVGMMIKTKFVWFLTYLFAILATDKNIIYKHHLRGLIEKERNREIQKIISTEYQQIYNKMLEEKNNGGSKIQFTMLCFDVEDDKNDPNIFNSVRNNNAETLKIIQLYKIPMDTTASTIIDKLKISFPDSNIIQKTNSNNDKDQNKCIEYTLFL